MVVYNYSGREINAKIVYYGPALSGKTTNLEWIYSKIPTEYSGKMVSLRTQADRTIFFDFLPLELGLIDGYKTRFMLYTVPGQVYYNATRKMVLKGVDGLVFVADSQEDRMAANVESFHNLQENLQELGLDLGSLPLVLQWNKRDLSNCVSPQLLQEQLNEFGVPAFEASALTGEGVYETLHRICRMIYQKLTLGEHAAASAGTEEESKSLFGDAIAERLQEVDVPLPEPEPIAVVAKPQAASGGAEAPSVLHTILGKSSGPAKASREEASPTSPITPSAETPPAAPGSRASASVPSQPRETAPPRAATSRPQPAPKGEPVMSDLLDNVLKQLDEIPDQDAEVSQDDAAPPPASTSGAFEAATGPVASDEDQPLIEHDVDLFDEMNSRAVQPAGAEEAQTSPPEDLQLITDPRRLADETAPTNAPRPSSTGVRPQSGWSGPVSNVKVLEVPMTLDADALEDGKNLRIVLNITVRR